MPDAVATLAEFASLLRQRVRAARRVLRTGPSDLDGDSVGAALALASGIRQLCGAHVTVSGRPGTRYDWLAGAADMVPETAVTPSHDVVIVVDGDRHRLHASVEAAFVAADARIILDHHHSTRPRGYELAWVDASAPSTCELVLAVLDCWGIELDVATAEQLYVGVVFDTGGFRHSNTRPSTHRAAARLLATGLDQSAISLRVLWERTRAGMGILGAVLSGARFGHDGRLAWGVVSLAQLRQHGGEYADLEGIVDLLLLTRGVELSCLMVERSPGNVKLSLRSRRWVDVAGLARSLDSSGGGHRRAAGVVLACTLDDALRRVPAALDAALAAVADGLTASS